MNHEHFVEPVIRTEGAGIELQKQRGMKELLFIDST